MLGLYRYNGQENGNYYIIVGNMGTYVYDIGLYRDNGKEHGNYYLGSRSSRYGHMGV